jgi:hypothetical protein
MSKTTLRVVPRDASSATVLDASVEGWGLAQLALRDIAPLRKAIPAWAPPDTPNHFFKYSDEQTILAVRAVDNAMERRGLDVQKQRDWAIITAPQFMGRVSGANVFRRFHAGGASAVSPHTIPQHSLHSVSGALSVLLASRGPNVAVGGGPGALAEGLLAATSLFDNAEAPGCWLVCTAWNPEPLPNREGNCVTEAVCHAFALALRPATAAGRCGRLTLRCDDRLPPKSCATQPLSIPQLVTRLALQDSEALPHLFAWDFAWGGSATLSLSPAAAQMPLAA